MVCSGDSEAAFYKKKNSRPTERNTVDQQKEIQMTNWQKSSLEVREKYG